MDDRDPPTSPTLGDLDDDAATQGRELRLMDDAVVREQCPGRCRLASNRLQSLGRQSAEEPTSRAGDRRNDGQLEFVDDTRGQQSLCDRDAGMDADITAGLVSQRTHEL